MPLWPVPLTGGGPSAYRATSPEGRPLQPELQQLPLAEHLHLGAVQRQPTVEGEQYGGEGAAECDGRLLVAAPPVDDVLGEVDNPLRVDAGGVVRRVQMDAAPR